MSNGEAKPGGPWPPAEWNRLELAVRRLLDSRDAWRRRAHAAERRIRELEAALDAVSSGSLDPVALADRAEQLSLENAALRRRLQAGRDRVQRLLHKLDVLEEAR